ncbi:hypothetical protein [Cupriavidus sp. AU9028]|uniref:hypothetical protein n=1 Tax=Cupriavidus sp. AU9028 TaxID=2871157 RepID=UPI001C96A0E5|nr:hypothetical protein [Cupriavidus sp. AU9028]MBY4896842.1 hypothetical protein [Cupriavidus sp. AU9028]
MQSITTLVGGSRVGHAGPLYFGLGAICAIKITLIGDVYIGEFIAAAYALTLLSTLRIQREYVSLLILTLMWAFAQALSDIANSTPMIVSLKGVLAPGVFFLTVFAVGSHFSRGNPQRMWYFLIGVAVSDIFNTSRMPTEEFLYNPWKWGYAAPAMLLLLSWLAMTRAGALRVAVAILIYCGVSALFDFRSAAGLPLLALVLYLLRGSRLGVQAYRLTRARGGVLLLFGIMAFTIALLNMVFSAIFAHAGDFGFLSPESVNKYTVQATSELGILFGGRSEILISLRAFLDAPVLGHGSWAVDRNGYQDALSVMVYQMGASLSDNLENFDNDLIPAHSFLMGGLVWSGFLGGVYWIGVLARAVWLYARNMPALPIYFHVGTAQLLWDVFFSPFSADHRWATGLFLGTLLAWHHLLAQQGARSAR